MQVLITITLLGMDRSKEMFRMLSLELNKNKNTIWNQFKASMNKKSKIRKWCMQMLLSLISNSNNNQLFRHNLLLKITKSFLNLNRWVAQINSNHKKLFFGNVDFNLFLKWFVLIDHLKKRTAWERFRDSNNLKIHRVFWKMELSNLLRNELIITRIAVMHNFTWILHRNLRCWMLKNIPTRKKRIMKEWRSKSTINMTQLDHLVINRWKALMRHLRILKKVSILLIITTITLIQSNS